MKYLFVATGIVTALLIGGCTLVPSLSSAHKLSDSDVRHLTAQGESFIMEGHYEKARPALESVASSPKSDANTHLLLGIARFQTGDLTGAHAAYDKAIQLDPTVVRAYQGKANVFRNQGNIPLALDWYRRAWETNPHFLDAYTEAALQMGARGDLAQGIEVLHQAIANNSESADLWRLLASLQVQSGERDEAVRSLRKAILFAPSLALSKAEQGLLGETN